MRNFQNGNPLALFHINILHAQSKEEAESHFLSYNALQKSTKSTFWTDAVYILDKYWYIDFPISTFTYIEFCLRDITNLVAN